MQKILKYRQICYVCIHVIQSMFNNKDENVHKGLTHQKWTIIELQEFENKKYFKKIIYSVNFC